MAIEIRRKQGEPQGIFLRRFSDRIRRSRIINQFKAARFYIKPKSRRMRKKAALERQRRKERFEYLRKIGARE